MMQLESQRRAVLTPQGQDLFAAEHKREGVAINDGGGQPDRQLMFLSFVEHIKEQNRVDFPFVL
jgi:hypothetical protein